MSTINYCAPDLAHTYLLEALSYDETTGVFTWKQRPLHHFKNADSQARINKLFAGRVAGCVGPMGYVALGLKGITWRAHRLVWFYMTGIWPNHLIDHIDGDRTNNAWANLRRATARENQGNRMVQVNNTSGFKGVVLNKRLEKSGNKCWQARIYINRRMVRLGHFATPEEASNAYMKAAREHFGEHAAKGDRHVSRS